MKKINWKVGDSITLNKILALYLQVLFAIGALLIIVLLANWNNLGSVLFIFSYFFLAYAFGYVGGKNLFKVDIAEYYKFTNNYYQFFYGKESDIPFSRMVLKAILFCIILPTVIIIFGIFFLQINYRIFLTTSLAGVFASPFFYPNKLNLNYAGEYF